MTCHASTLCDDRSSATLSAAVHVAKIDTRLVAAVQARAGARIHEAAGLLNGYYIWSELLKRALTRKNESKASLAFGQVCAAKLKLRQFLVPAVANYA